MKVLVVGAGTGVQSMNQYIPSNEGMGEKYRLALKDLLLFITLKKITQLYWYTVCP